MGSLALKIVIAVLALTGSSLWAQDGLAGALSRASASQQGVFRSPLAQTLAAADFDGDNKPDGAVLLHENWARLQSSFRAIELHFTGRKNTDLTFQSTEDDLTLSALDVNGDGTIDIVVEQAFTHKRLHVWLNDGRGGFRKVRSEDFQFAAPENPQRLESPARRPNSPAFCLASQCGPETAILTASPRLRLSSWGSAHARPCGSPPGWGATAPGSPRAPPSAKSL